MSRLLPSMNDRKRLSFCFFRPIIYYGGRSKLQREGKKHTVSKAFFERLLFFNVWNYTHCWRRNKQNIPWLEKARRWGQHRLPVLVALKKRPHHFPQKKHLHWKFNNIPNLFYQFYRWHKTILLLLIIITVIVIYSNNSNNNNKNNDNNHNNNI